MIWWHENPTRARSERQGVAELAERVGWLKGVHWRLSDGAALAVDFEIEHDGGSVPLTMTYAEFHPNSPPIVLPRDGSRFRTISMARAETSASNIVPIIGRRPSPAR
jgi:sulfur-carrier protein adenylyltransferase/sulfurtransferase